jgi:mono/diheme cytochrome c family protein/uncharacterized protein YjiS (DUF1127 family)
MESAMTDLAVYRPVKELSVAARAREFAVRLARALERALVAGQVQRELNALPDLMLRDIGINRSDIQFVADALASGKSDPTRSAVDRVNRSTARRRLSLSRNERPAPLTMFRMLFSAAAVAMCVLSANSDAALAQDAQIKRGQYLVTLGGCNDCHTPGYFFGKPDMARFLGGSEVGFEIPGLGTFHGPNLTPDVETGLGAWSTEQIAIAISKGRRPDGRELAPIMPWHAFANLTAQDVRAIATYLKSLPPVKNKVPGPFGPSEQPTSFVMKIVPPQQPTTGGAAAR